LQLTPNPVIVCRMRDWLVLMAHLIVTTIRTVTPGGARAVIGESLLLKHQLLILNRSQKKAPRLHAITTGGYDGPHARLWTGLHMTGSDGIAPAEASVHQDSTDRAQTTQTALARVALTCLLWSRDWRCCRRGQLPPIPLWGDASGPRPSPDPPRKFAGGRMRSRTFSGRIPRRRATMTACVRLRASSLRKMVLRCVFTVSVVRDVARAISLLQSPTNNSPRTSSSLGVSFSHLIRSAIRDATNGARARPPS
jgi:hypothetical protein